MKAPKYSPTWFPPDQFKLGGRTWTTELVHRRGQWAGTCTPSHCRIRLNLRCIESDEEMRHTFIHELLHAVAATMGWKSFYRNEGKIDALACLLTQFEATAVWRG
ncbi:MAG: hypothetical protein A3E01_07050 [Gammaproteobacteria bacterium RIFCSPHIGHO2_12_FULL_63_22]|nr:MAG: hypothetical protein A3E01_07050 [Gammaproteobacteria bacterium RIFCSPHIGHO2_12_FULL_63_22]